MSARYSATDYGAAARALLPRGRVWNFEPGSVQGAVVDSLMPAAERVDAAGVGLVADIFPGTTGVLIEEWEATLGLPDPCLGTDPTLAQRRDQIVARFAAGGGQTVADMIAFAGALGFVVTIDERSPLRAGGRVGAPLGGEAWAFAWQVVIVSGATSADHARFRAGGNRAGDRLASTSSALAALECELRRMAPLHTILAFSL